MFEPIVTLLVGAAALLFGRRLFWIFVAVAGFVLGVTVAPLLLPNQPEWVILLAALAAGVVGGILAVAFQQLAIAIAGFIFGGYILQELLRYFGMDLSQWWLVIFVLGGIIGALLVLRLFDPALILLSSLAGALIITGVFRLTPPLDWIVFGVLLVVGLAFQTGRLRLNTARSKSPPPK